MKARDVRVGDHAIFELTGEMVEIIEEPRVIGRDDGWCVVLVRSMEEPYDTHNARVESLTSVEDAAPAASPSRRSKRVRA